MKFDLILTNPPFQDTTNRGKTPHKLWIDFTKAVFDRLLVDDGVLCQVSPSSFGSPSNRVLKLMKKHQTLRIRYDTGDFFPKVGSTFSDYVIRKANNDGTLTEVVAAGETSSVALDDDLFYLPKDLAPEALSIHRKVVFHPEDKLPVEKDYVTCFNILLRRSDTLSKTQTEQHIYPVFHTNRQIWWSSIRQEWADAKKVMWTRSGYTKPFYDDGELGGTDMVYFCRVDSREEGQHLAHNLNLQVLRYIYATARWSGFGDHKVFAALPKMPTDKELSDDEFASMFGLTSEEVSHVGRYMGEDR